jgi:hypothetical protein
MGSGFAIITIFLQPTFHISGRHSPRTQLVHERSIANAPLGCERLESAKHPHIKPDGDQLSRLLNGYHPARSSHPAVECGIAIWNS